MLAQLVEALAHAALDDVLEVDDAEHEVVLRDDERRAARSGDAGRPPRRARAGTLAALLLDPALDGVGGALADSGCRSCRRRSSASSRENGMNVASCSPSSRPRRPNCSFASTTIERPSGVSSASEASCATSASSLLVDAVDGDELGGLAVAERDRAGLVEQQHVDVAGRLDGAARHREHVALHEPVHAGDADRREQRADRGRDQRDEQRDQHGLRDAACRRRSRTASASTTAARKVIVRPASRMLSAISFGVLRRSAPSTSAIMRSRNDLPGSCVTSITSRSESSLRAAGDGRAVAAGLADHRRRLAGDRRLVDRADALDDLAVGGDHLAGARRRRRRRAAAPAPGTSSSVPSAARRCAIVVVRVARSAFACALPRPSAIASAKFAKSTVSQSQSAITPTNQSWSVSPADEVEEEDRRS